MSEKTGIEWCDSTFNPWVGCTKVGPGCDHCYAETMDARKVFNGVQHWGPGVARMRTSESNWRLPYKWNNNADKFFAQHGRRQRVFCASLADVFDNEVDPKWRQDLLFLIDQTPNLDWLILTKRIGNVMKMVEEADAHISRVHRSIGWPMKNVWLGATVVNQEEADRDIPKLLNTPAAIRFLSMEPLLGAVGLSKFMARAPYYMTKCEICGWVGSTEFCGSSEDEVYCHSCRRSICGDDAPGIDWVIVGGESGNGARPMNPNWVRTIRDQCIAADVPFLYKQWGNFMPAVVRPGGDLGGEMRRGSVVLVKRVGENDGHFSEGDALMRRADKHAAGRLLDGVTHDGYPKVDV